jgi:hypothetical protein
MKTPPTLVAMAAAALLAACNPPAPPQAPPQDRYDVSKMDLKPTPAKVSTERQEAVSLKARRSAWVPS